MNRKITCLLMILIVLLPSIHTAAQAHSLTRPLSPVDQTRYLALSAADFHPNSHADTYENQGNFLSVLSVPTGETSAKFTAAVNIHPDSVLRKMTFNFRTNAPQHRMTARLYVLTSQSGTVTQLGEVTNQLPGETAPAAPYFYQNSIQLANVRYSMDDTYFIEVELPVSSTDESVMNWLYGVSLEYTLPNEQKYYSSFVTPTGVMVPRQDGYAYRVSEGSIRHLGDSPTSTGNGSYLLKLNLPDGAQIYGFSPIYREYSMSRKATVSLQVSDIAAHDYQTLATWSTSPGIYENVSGYAPFKMTTVDNHAKSYWLSLELPAIAPNDYIDIRSIRVYYTQPTYADEHRSMISTAAFIPSATSYRFEQYGHSLKHFGAGHGTYIAPLDVPDGSIIRSITANFFDQAAGDGNQVSVTLRRTNGTGDYTDLSTLSSASDTGYSTVSDASLNSDDAMVDQKQYAYWLVLDLPPSAHTGEALQAGDFALQSVQVDYTNVFTRVHNLYLPGVVR